MFRLAGNGERWVVTLAQEDSGEAEMAAHGFDDEVLPFDGDEACGGPAGAGEGGAKLLDARVLATFYEAETGANGPGKHRGDFTPTRMYGWRYPVHREHFPFAWFNRPVRFCGEEYV
jgi:hypothetical protein